MSIQEPTHKVEARKTALEEAVSHEKDVAEALKDKEIEVQQDKHKTLRTGSVPMLRGAGVHQRWMGAVSQSLGHV